MKKSMVIAHRGASKAAPENTMSAFKKALEYGAQGIELDVHLTSDGQLVVIHDEKVDRTSDGTGLVKDKTLEELRTLDFGSWFSPEFKGETISTLSEVMELLKDWKGLLNIEVKSGPIIYPGIEQKIVNEINKFSKKEHVIISSFNHYSLVEIKKIDSNIKTGILYIAGLFQPWIYAKQIGACAIHPAYYGIVPEIVIGCLKNGVAVNTFTVDDPETIKKIASIGVTGIITNVPDVALKILKD